MSFDSDAFGDGAVLGCDFTGIVQKVGDGVTRLRKGDAVAGLVWGASVGQYAIQEAAKYQLRIVTTCSPKHFDTVKKFGAHHVFDYRSQGVVEQIKSAAPDLKYVFDTIGSRSSSGLASQAVRSTGGTLCTVRPGKANTEDVDSSVEVTDVLPSKDDHELAAELFEKLPEWLETGIIKANATRILPGLESVPKGFDMHRNGDISGFKVVYQLG
ncbi:Zinc-binding oxidoreductase alcohol dehydrogenase [Neofusicoccum ribis]|uniref:Zinc-binding oxidoreductase alcohol dehydrogenase n=1 Tax=Neofusicoccum ribis TaxID=45134 RepID=A0ABR3SDZ2_9PEZI